jgi:hypothetical protein
VVDESSKVSRATVEQVYQQAITDLKDAEANMDKPLQASAILARLYLQKGDYTNAVIEADKVIGSEEYSLVNPYSAEFPNTGGHVDDTPEDIFSLQVTSQQGTNSLNTYYASADNSGRGDIIIRDSFLDEFEAGDERLNVYNLDSDDILRVSKFDNLYGNVRVVRLAEMYLIRAEGNLRLGTVTGDTPKNDVNAIRNRAGLGDLGAVTIANVLAERRHELAFEGGFFLHDAKRLALNVGALPYSSPRLVFPIPLREINANPNLKQNEGYGQ